RLARKEVAVALAGDGGDELFGGYEAYRAQLISGWWQKIPAWLRIGVLHRIGEQLRPRKAKKGLANAYRRFVQGVREDNRLGHARWRLQAGLTMQSALLSRSALQESGVNIGRHIESLYDQSAGLEAGNRPLYVDFRSYLVDNCLAKVDRMSMACSLEVRVPMLDLRVVEAAFTMPSRLKYSMRSSKILLRRLACKSLPADCINRPKQGFSAPVRHWLNSSLKTELRRLLDPARLMRAGLFNVETVARLCQEHERGVADHAHILWTLMVFEDWRERWGVHS
ncbi:MAG: asparagine synthase-related protein, partial [Steroidobacteraceae bacterium]